MTENSSSNENEMKLKSLTTRRGQIKSQITRFSTFLDRFDNSKSISELESRLEKIETLWKDFNDIQLQIELINDSDEQLEHRESFENTFFEITARAKDIILSRKVSVTNNPHNYVSVAGNMPNSTGVSNPTNSLVQLPSINLPKFDGRYGNWLSFRDSFNALVNRNTNISIIQKFFYLKLSLTGVAAEVIAELEVTEDNYSVAWKILETRFENKKIICYSHVKALFELQGLGKESLQDLQKLIDDFNKHIRALNKLGEPTEYWSTMLIYLVCSKLDRNSQKEWNKEASKLENVTIDDLINFLTERCHFLETIETNTKTFKGSLSSYSHEKSRDKTFAHIAQNVACYYCKGTHYIYNCKNFEKLSLKARYDEIKKIGLCTNCFRQGHFATECRSSGCKKCSKKHNSLLHNDSFSNKQTDTNNRQTNTSNSQENENKPNSNMSTSSSNVLTSTAAETRSESQNLVVMMHNKTYSSPSPDTYVLLSTAIINVLDYQGRPVKARAILDSGSMSSFMSRKLLSELNLPYSHVNTKILGLNDASSNTSMRTSATIMSNTSGYKKEVSFLVVNQVTKNIPIVSFETDNLNLPDSIMLADPNFNISSTIDILIGAEIYYDLLCTGQIKLGINKPILQKSKFGWLVSGPINFTKLDETISQCHLTTNQIIQNKLEEFWRIEEVPLAKISNKQDLKCEQIFTETLRTNETGRFVVTLPMIDPVPELGNSRDLAINKFLSLERKLSKSPELKRQYHDFLLEYEKLGHMTKIDPEMITEHDKLIYYLPHHGVIRENSLTTKLRVVFNGSFETSNGTSLNDILLIGPQLQEDLFSIITRFRKHNYVMIADIEKMYRMVEVTESQRNLQRIIWRYDANEPLNHYRLNTLTYGTGPASFLAIRCLHQCALENEEKFPVASRTISMDFYVDDLITGSESIEDAIDLKQNISNILSSHGFNLRKWASNEPSILNANSVCKNSHYLITDDTNHKTLGLLWHSDTDILKFVVKLNDDEMNRKVTKRTILSTISQIFDPMGLVGPITIKSKIILQRLWQSKVDWDDSVPSALEIEFNNLKRQLPSLANISVPRHAILPNPILIQMHNFCDASQLAYGACVYIVSEDSFGNRSSNLLCAKSRVAPLKVISLPRLELCGALLLAELADKAEKSLKINFHDKIYWCDSTIVLNWLHAEPNNWQVFVANRVAEIQRLTSIDKWRHVSSQFNPADIISRGLDPDKLKDCALWWSGPPWLLEPQNLWPEINNDFNLDNVPEKRKRIFSGVIVQDHAVDFDIINKCSSLMKLQRIISYCLRFINNCSKKNKAISGILNLDELDYALVVLVKIVQSQEFNHELKLLKSGKSVPPSSKLASLNPFLDKNNLIRVGGRISRAMVSYDMKHPIVLPSNNHFTDLVINHEHKLSLHIGVQGTLAAIRHKFWPLKGKSTVKKVLRKCMVCFRAKPTVLAQQMSELPEYRLTPSRPFLVCGTDFAGPFIIKDGKTRNRKLIKVYLCIFVCFSSKAVHFELVGDLTSDGFLNAFKRFVSRRGLCTDIFSDNGTNYIGANNELNHVYLLLSNMSKESKFLNYMHENHIKWHFAPARSPHFGGLYEAAVKSAKFHLKRIVGNANLTYEELYTVIVQAESVLNSRPLVPISHEPNDLIALTPGHLIIGDSLTAVPQENLVEIPANRLTQYKKLQQMLQHFWHRWKHEYLSTLQNRNKWKSKCSNDQLQPGALVLVKDENTPPLKWPLARILNTFPGQDGLVRVVTVKTASGVFKRPITKICVLPINDF